jgi:formylglycine-generating enzyme required for sulfatase activity
LLGDGVEMTFSFIPPGSFFLGSPEKEEERHDNERQHRVTLTRGFFLGVTPVTRGQFAQFVRAVGYQTEAERAGGAWGWTGSRFEQDPKYNWKSPGFPQEDDHPVVCVSWNAAVAFCEWLSRQDGGRVRFELPTEAEWEYACRAGTQTPFWWGSSISTDQANYDGNHTYGRGGKKGVYRKTTTPVDSFPANAWKLRDMHGNVWEWCQDWFGDYPEEDFADPKGPDRGSARVLRGGSWYFVPRHCRAADRNGGDPGYRCALIGCRLVTRLD